MRLALTSLASSLLLALAACGPAEPVAQQEGDNCSVFDAPYTCNLAGDTILVCSESNLWERVATCDQNSPCELAESDSGQQLCCTVERQQVCYPEM